MMTMTYEFIHGKWLNISLAKSLPMILQKTTQVEWEWPFVFLNLEFRNLSLSNFVVIMMAELTCILLAQC